MASSTQNVKRKGQAYSNQPARTPRVLCSVHRAHSRLARCVGARCTWFMHLEAANRSVETYGLRAGNPVNVGTVCQIRLKGGAVGIP